jgi:type III secretion protein U
MEEKNQKPTSKRLRDARKRGEVVFSHDVANSASFIAALAALWMAGSLGYSLVQALWLQATSAPMLAQPAENFAALLLVTGESFLWGTLPIVLVSLAGAVAASFFQVGGLAAWERIKPDMNRMNPAEGFKRIVCTRNLVNLLKMLLKTALLAGLMVVIVKAHVNTALKLGHAHPATILGAGAHIILVTFGWAALIYVLMAAVDYAHQHYEFMKQQRMSLDEVRREYKDNEGDPVNSSRRRAAHFEAVYASLADRVRAASAVIHANSVAVALQYQGERDLPRVIARGEGNVAAQIRRFAEEALIPIEFDAQLAQRLYEDVGQDMPIPRALYERVARLLRWAQGAS